MCQALTGMPILENDTQTRSKLRVARRRKAVPNQHTGPGPEPTRELPDRTRALPDLVRFESWCVAAPKCGRPQGPCRPDRLASATTT